MHFYIYRKHAQDVRTPCNWLEALRNDNLKVSLNKFLNGIWENDSFDSLLNKVCNITGNGLLNSFIEFFKSFSECNVFFFLRNNKMSKFYHFLLAKNNHSKRFQKTFLNHFVRFQKIKYERLQSSLHCEIVVLQL